MRATTGVYARCRQNRTATVAVLVGVAVLVAVASWWWLRQPVPARLSDIAVSGCAAVRRGDVCEVTGATELTIWVGAKTTAQLTVKLDGVLLDDVPRQRAVEGWRLQLSIPASEVVRRIEVARREGEALSAYAFELRPQQEPTVVQRARQLLQERAFEALDQHLEEPLREENAPHYAALLSIQARRALRSQDHPRAIALLQQSAQRHRRDGLLSQSAWDTFALSWLLTHSTAQFVEARNVLDVLEVQAPLLAVERADAAYYRAGLAVLTGDYVHALPQLRHGLEICERMGLQKSRTWHDLTQLYALTLGALGDPQNAARVLRDLLGAMAESLPCNRRALAMHNLGWLQLQAGHSEQAVTELRRALDILERDCPRDDQALALVHIDLALAQVRIGDVALASEALRRADGLLPSPSLLDAHALAIARGRVAEANTDDERAATIWRQLAARARTAAHFEIEWQAETGLGRIAARREDLPAAIAHARRAEALIGRAALLAPVAEGRSGFLADRDESGQLLVTLLLRADRPAEAMRAARRMRRRLFTALSVTRQRAAGGDDTRMLAARARFQRARAALDTALDERWKRSADALDAHDDKLELLRADVRAALDEIAQQTPSPSALPELPPDVLALLVMPGRKEGRTWVLGRFAGRVRAHAVDQLQPQANPDALATALLEPWAQALDEAKALRWMPYGLWNDLELHALPWRGAPLRLRLPVSYVIDSAPPEQHSRAKHAVVVVDPSGNLPGSRQGAERVASALKMTGWAPQVLRQLQARPEQVRSALRNATLFYYAGHATFRGREGYDSALLLADGELNVSDVLTSPEVPAVVVLAGCETAGAERKMGRGGVGLAQAFVAAGARHVVATSRPIRDGLGAALADGFAQQLSAGHTPEAAYHVTLQALVRTHPDEDWAAFQLWSP